MKQGLLMGRFYRLRLTAAEIKALKHVADETSGTGAAGGWQTLVRMLRDRLDGTMLEIDERELERVHRYCERYGNGGYQDALKGVRRAAWDAGWTQR